MKRIHILFAVPFVFLLASASSAVYALAAGQIDTFEDGTTQGWVVALFGAEHPDPPVNTPTGGPAGADDNFLQLTAVGGSGAGNRLAVINLTQWTGDFLAANITGIRMDCMNTGSTDLSLRLYFADPQGGPPENSALSTLALSLPAGGGWVSLDFPIGISDLTAGEGTVSAALTGATEMRLYHSPTAEFPGPPIVASLGVDNILAIPEPSAIILLGLGGMLLFRPIRKIR